MLNKLTTKSDVVALKEYIDKNQWDKLYPHHLWVKQDVVVKWGGLLSNIHEVCTPESLVMDVGCGSCPLPAIVSPWCKHVYGVDSCFSPSWGGPNVTYVLGDGIGYLHSFAPETFDIIYDSCAVIHFNTSSEPQIYNHGFWAFLKAGERALKRGGWMFIICDCAEWNLAGEFFSPNSMLEMINRTSLKPISPIDLTVTEDTLKWEAGYGIVSFALQKV